MNETIRNKEFSLFFKEKEALRDFFHSVIIHAYIEEFKSGFYYTIKYTMKKLIDECEFKIQFSKKTNN